MRLKDIFSDLTTAIFAATNQSDIDELNWMVEPTNLEIIPDDENIYFVKAKQLVGSVTKDCYLGIMTPERIAETVVKQNENSKVVAESVYEQIQSVTPVVASDCPGDYNLYYNRENPQIGIDVLCNGLRMATKKNVAAEDLGYILRDEERIEEAIEALV